MALFFFTLLALALCLYFPRRHWRRIRSNSFQEEHMDFLIAGIIAAFLAGYLIYALLYPEKF